MYLKINTNLHNTLINGPSLQRAGKVTIASVRNGRLGKDLLE